MDYIVNLNFAYTDVQKMNAFAKAPKDVIHTLLDSGANMLSYEPKRDLFVKVTWKLFLRTLAKKHYSKICKHTMENMFSSVNVGDRVFFQYSWADNTLKSAILEAKRHGAKIHLIIHDVCSLRFDEPANEEMAIYSLADVLYVHTEAMVELLHEWGVKVDMKIMHLFDYYSDDPITSLEKVKKGKHIIVFAGNLEKSEFLAPLMNMDIPANYTVNLYGLLGQLTINNVRVRYKNKFKPDNTGVIEGGWGLLWDGPSIETCDGNFGKYLRYNSSHKLSLYLTQGIPVVVWSESSLSDWIKKENVGICVNSLEEMFHIIDALSDYDYGVMIENAHRVGDRLRRGDFFKSLIK